MKKTIKKLFRNKVTVLMLIITLVTVMVMSFLCFSYYFKVKDTIKQESESYISEVTKQISNNVSRTIDDNFSALKTIAAVLNNKDLQSFAVLSAQVASLQEHWQYNEILVIDKDAQSYNEDGNKVRLSNDVYLQEALIGRKPAMSASEQIDSNECVVFVIPVNFTIGGTNILALAATYGLDTFDKILSMTAFEGAGYAHIIHKSGTIVVRSSVENSFDAGYNLLNSLQDANFADKKLPEIRTDILLSKNGFSELKIADESLYMSYRNLGDNQYYVDWRIVTFVPVKQVSDKSNLLITLTLLLSGGITLVFAVLIAILSVVTVKSRRKLEKIAYIDNVTNGNTFQKFRELANKILQNNKDNNYTLLYINIGKFKVLNDQYGRAVCDKLLTAIDSSINNSLDADECMGRLFADNFVVLLKIENQQEFDSRVSVWKTAWNAFFIKNKLPELPFIIEVGVYTIKDRALMLSQFIDRAKLSLKQVNHYSIDNLRVYLYNDDIGNALKREKQLEDIMERALINKEFLVYLQPKYTTETEKIGGAEALSRWQSAKEGMIYPDEFIPLFEKNGFIKKLDLYVFDHVCQTQRLWIDNNVKPIKISVNCSRVHLQDENFIDKYVEIVNKYGIPFKNLEIEFTESVVFEDLEYLSKVINKIKEYGFGCSMDDFGSGYSSLSMIQDIPVDTIKLDKVFFRKRSNLTEDRTEAVVTSIVNLSKALTMTVVAEGVEDKEQVLILKRLKCDLIQGYYYAKPMPILQFEQLAFGKEISAIKGV